MSAIKRKFLKYFANSHFPGIFSLHAHFEPRHVIGPLPAESRLLWRADWDLGDNAWQLEKNHMNKFYIRMAKSRNRQCFPGWTIIKQNYWNTKCFATIFKLEERPIKVILLPTFKFVKTHLEREGGRLPRWARPAIYFYSLGCDRSLTPGYQLKTKTCC